MLLMRIHPFPILKNFRHLVLNCTDLQSWMAGAYSPGREGFYMMALLINNFGYIVVCSLFILIGCYFFHLFYQWERNFYLFLAVVMFLGAISVLIPMFFKGNVVSNTLAQFWGFNFKKDNNLLIPFKHVGQRCSCHCH